MKDFYTSNKYNNSQDISLPLVRMLKSDIEFFRLNKLLVGLAELCSSLSYRSDILDQRLRRYQVYCEEAKRISYAMDSGNIRFAFIKTITIFPKDIADLDILILDMDDLKNSERVLAEAGYEKRKKGLEQHLWSLSRDGVIVDVELHTSVAAAGYEYYPKHIIFKNIVDLNGIKTTSPLDSLILSVAHSVVKDLYITLADILDFTLTLNRYKVNLDLLTHYAKDLGLLIPLILYLSLLETFDDDMRENLANYGSMRKFFTAMNYGKMPLRPRIYTLILSYLEMTLGKLQYEPPSTILSEILSLPRGKGVDGLLYYMTGAKPPVKKLSE
ncbi:MAG: nucleotidyltransferase family protein [Thermoproteota archaeon]